MDDNINYVDLVRQAQLGNIECMDRLAQLTRGRIYAYIYRLTLNKDLAQDLLQETQLEMVSSLELLRQPELFWSWLFRTALGKVQHHFRKPEHKKKVSLSSLGEEEMGGQRFQVDALRGQEAAGTETGKEKLTFDDENDLQTRSSLAVGVGVAASLVPPACSHRSRKGAVAVRKRSRPISGSATAG